jgi:hypothetical protein
MGTATSDKQPHSDQYLGDQLFEILEFSQAISKES